MSEPPTSLHRAKAHDVLEAARRIRPHLARTPLRSYAPLDAAVGSGVQVFVKKVPLTELERRSEHVMSTANLFGLPAFYQYPLGSAGFGAWRELAAHVMTTNWVLAGGYQGFPLLFGWRPYVVESASMAPRIKVGDVIECFELVEEARTL